ncbi:acyltransferase [Chloroflexota bacterium]
MQTLKDDWFTRGLPFGFKMGENSYLNSAYSFLHCSLSAHNVIEIGHHTVIYTGTFFELGPNASVQIGNFTGMGDVVIRAESEITIGNYVMIAFGSVITDCESLVSLTRRSWEIKQFPPANCSPKPIRIGDYVWIGFRATILAGVTIGKGAIVGAGAVVSEDVPPMTIVAGNPARELKRVQP